jgi:lipooligosaccharide transport system ATP-binding protein
VPAPDVLIHARGLAKSFGGAVAVAGIDFDLRRGEAFGFLGPNGAGKSSTMRMIGCVSPPSGGELTILGLDPVADGPAIRARLGVVPQEDTLDVELTVRENLIIYGRYFGLPRDVIAERAARLLEFVQLADRAADQVEPLSGGMKRRLTIARSLINEPEILLLDEPTTGLDPQARHAVWDRLYRLKQRGVTLVLTTHYMDEAEQLCDRLVVMDRGKIAAEGSPRDLIGRYSTPEVLELRFDPAEHQQAADKLAELAPQRGGEGGSSPLGQIQLAELVPQPGADGRASPPGSAQPADALAERAEVLADRVLLYTQDGDTALAAVRGLGLEPVTSLVRRSTLEDVFLRLTGRQLED